MYCITRNDMKFGDYFIPARTKARVINKPNTDTVDAPGVQLIIEIRLWDIKNKPCPICEVQINNELQQKSYGGTDSLFTGITISTNTTEIYMNAGDGLYWHKILYRWQIEKIFPNGIPDNMEIPTFLHSVVDYLEEEFAEWVRGNCEFYELTEENIENGEGSSGSEPGDRTLSVQGLEQFENKKLEYQAVLEKIGFTYDFKGGLIWE